MSHIPDPEILLTDRTNCKPCDPSNLPKLSLLPALKNYSSMYTNGEEEYK